MGFPGDKMELNELIQRALTIRKFYREYEQKQYGISWTNEELVLGFVGDVGDLAKLVIAYNGYRNIPAIKNKLAHELADRLWSVIILADVYGVDLEYAFLQTMDEIESRLKNDPSVVG